jgi:DNA-binding NtrC family response regulator
VRELKNYVQRVYILADGVVDVDLAPRTFSEPTQTPLITVRVGSTLEEMNRRLIEATLAECGGVRRKAAEMLGISLKTLYNRLAQYKAEGATLPAEPRGSSHPEDEYDEQRA